MAENMDDESVIMVLGVMVMVEMRLGAGGGFSLSFSARATALLAFVPGVRTSLVGESIIVTTGVGWVLKKNEGQNCRGEMYYTSSKDNQLYQ